MLNGNISSMLSRYHFGIILTPYDISEFMLVLKLNGVALTVTFSKALEIEMAGVVIASDLYSASHSPTGLCPCPLTVSSGVKDKSSTAERKTRIKYIVNGVKQRAHCIHMPWF